MNDLNETSDVVIDHQEIQHFASELIAKLSNAVKDWKVKKEQTYDGKTYRNYSTTVVDPNSDEAATFMQVQLVYENSTDNNAFEGGLTETAPDTNGSLHEYHFAANLKSGTESEIRYVEYPYRQEEFGRPLINTKTAISTAESMIQRLPQLD
ncbi:MAG: hypothetical protein ACR2LN_05985 [Candidatus Levyibacteriota bacterium]